jgi:uncharacterized RDD family membrane protein YckC
MGQNKYDIIFRRLFAKILDYIVFGIFSWLLVWIFVPETTYRFEKNTQNGEFSFVENSNVNSDFFLQYGEISLSLFLIVYFIVSHFFFGKTLGKAIFNVKVFDVEQKKPITFLQAFLRNTPDLIYALFIFFNHYHYLPFALLLIWNISNLIQVFSNKKYRTINDLFAKTVVLKTVKSENI